MSRRKKSPQICRQRYRAKGRSDLAFVELSGDRIHLGEFGSDEAIRRYHREVQAWIDRGRQPQVAKEVLTVVELVARFLDHAEDYYRPSNGSTSEVEHFTAALRPLMSLYGGLPANQFSPKKLRSVRNEMIAAKWTRQHINKQISRIRLMIKWAVGEEHIDGKVLHDLMGVETLPYGRHGVREQRDVRPVPDEHIAAVRPFVSRQVWAIIQLQRWSGSRGGEVLRLRSVDIDMTDDIWIYRPAVHKTAYRGHKRKIYLNKRCQDVIAPFLNRPVDAYMFSPKEAVRELNDDADTHRQKDQAPNRAKTSRTLGDRYTPDSYRVAIRRACKKAGISNWHPHQLRHSFTDMVEKAHGIEIASLAAGHKSTMITERYVSRDDRAAMDALRQLG